MNNKVYGVIETLWMYELELNTEITYGIFSTRENAEKAKEIVMKNLIKSTENRNLAFSVNTETDTIEINGEFGEEDHIFRITEWTLDTYMSEDQDGFPMEIPLQ